MDICTKTLNCQACGMPIKERPLNIKNLPIASFPTTRDYGSADLNLLFCDKCGHFSQSEPKKDILRVIYEEIYSDGPYNQNEYGLNNYSDAFLAFFSEIMTEKNQPNPTNSIDLLEIGCGDPRRLHYFAEKGYNCFGIEPSPLAHIDTKYNNIKIIRGYVEDFSLDKKFDIILMRFCLEHIIDINAIMRRCVELLNPDGRLFIQVPNNEFFMHNRPPLFAAHEHIHYFTRQSLDSLALRGGVIVESTNANHNTSLISSYKKSTDWRGKMNSFQNSETMIEKEMCIFLNEHPDPIFYGWGGLFIWILTKFPLKNCKGVLIDDMKSFQGRVVPGTTMRVCDLGDVNASESDTVLLCVNTIYHSKLLNKIQITLPQAKVYGVTSDGICKLN